ncbi:ABC transporter permease [Myroides marinus]|uniref:ABC transporter permease n=1 Tax=Myroides marinus TaxID=703342 RepID=UPI0025787CFB|nr:ABC transporter permease [Myroides marinus]MDM1367562.1 ABC transporter permease [Myroides marinus]MDM1371771.1 ABC transporter permease [Myroides marinus]MDM1374751.1 ABC transporter permease [Myroides marinus]MDM1382256.1 ABC transporter permease [Myroides marinus]MDM1389429.1 ABC transporter permease [Myroides marinus]
MIKNWLKIYWSNVLKSKVYFILTLLSLGIGFASVILSFVHYREEVSYDQTNPNKDNLFTVESKMNADTSWMKLPYPFGSKIKEESSHVIDYTYMNNYYDDGIFFINGEKKAVERVVDVKTNFFEFFPFEIVSGDKKQPFSGPNTAVVSDEYAKTLFGDKNPVGQTFIYYEQTYTVSAVYKIGENRSSVMANVLVNDIDRYEKEALEDWGNYSSTIWLKLDNPNSVPSVEKMIREFLIKDLAKDAGMSLEEYIKKEEGMTVGEFLNKNNDRGNFRLHVLADQRMQKDRWLNGTPEGGANVGRLYIMIGLSLLILILSVFNYINLSTAQAISRTREIGIRKTLGATRGNLILQGLFEAFVTSMLACIVALVIIEFVMPWLKVFLDSRMEIEFTYILPWLLLFMVLIVLLVGLIPALFTASFKTLEVLKGEINKSKKGKTLKSAMLIVQFTVACFFMIGSYIVYQQVSYMIHKDLGFKGEQVVLIPYFVKVPFKEKANTYYSIKEEILKVRGVEDVSTASITIGTNNGSSSGFTYNGNKIQGINVGMDYNYLDMLSIELKEGRVLSSDYATDTISNIMISERTAYEMQEPSPVGKVIEWNENKMTIVGVVKDFNLYGLRANYAPLVYFHLKTIPWVGNNIREVAIRVKGDNIEQTMGEIAKIWERRDLSDFPFSYKFADKRFAETFEGVKKERDVFMTLNAVVVFVALFGLYSLASFNINNRLREVAIRKVLGASAGSLLKQLSIQYFIMCVTGFAFAVFPSYYFLNKWLNDYAFRIEISALPFVVCFIGIVILTGVVVFIKAWSATKINVLKYIKYE